MAGKMDLLDPSELIGGIERLKRLLFHNIVPTWYPKSLDHLWGGYRIDNSLFEKKAPRNNKMIVTQARMAWFFSRLARFLGEQQPYLNAAKKGVRFLDARMRDKNYGGYFVMVSPSGLRIIDNSKHLYCQTISLMALSEYAHCSHDEHAVALARELFQCIESRAHDKRSHGYRETFCSNWEPLLETETGFLGTSSKWKTLNTHIHVIESFTCYLALHHDELAVARTRELINLMRSLAAAASPNPLVDVYDLEWKAITNTESDRVSFGHNLELIWFFLDACNAVHEDIRPDIKWLENLFDYCFHSGFDQHSGGFFESGPLNREADRLDKIWWVQAEALVCAVTLYRLTHKRNYWECFLRTLSWIENHQADWDRGEWYNRITIDGRQRGAKVAPWKAAYHNGRAMMECIERLQSIQCNGRNSQDAVQKL